MGSCGPWGPKAHVLLWPVVPGGLALMGPGGPEAHGPRGTFGFMAYGARRPRRHIGKRNK
eukprot:8249854-Karenia_brevis.AAC.1